MRSCSLVKFQALVTLECFKCDELSRPPCLMQLNFDVFDHFLTVKVAGIFWGAPAPPLSPPTFGGLRHPTPQCHGPRSKKPCASANNIGPGRKVERALALLLHSRSQHNIVTRRSKTLSITDLSWHQKMFILE